MKLENIFVLGILFAGMALTTACDDQLSALPTQQKVEGNVVVDQKSAIAALNGIYYQFAQCKIDNYGVYSTGCASTYEVYPSNISGIVVYYQGPYMFEVHGGNGYESNGSYIWQPFYQQMAAINGVIDQVTKADDSWFAENKKTEILAEAYGMRAIVNYNLLRYFGYSWDIDSPYGNILRMEASSSKKLACPRSNVKDTYQAILEDLDIAIRDGAETGPNYYVNKWVAMGQKVRVLMARGQEGDYAEAARLAKEIIEQGPYQLEARTTDIFHNLGLESSEVMFGIKPQNRGGQQTAVMEAYYYRNSAEWNYSDNFYNLLKNDPRKDDFVLEALGQVLVYDYDDDGNYTGYHWEDAITTTVCKHFKPTAIIANEVEESQYMMRLTEIYLLRAEALARTNQVAEAKALLKTVMEHAGITDFTALDAVNDERTFMEEYFKEFLKNLFCENGQDFDLMFRMPKELVYAFNPEYYEGVYDADGNFRSVGEPLFGKAIFAIPADEFKNNNLLPKSAQNPGYATY